MGMLNGDMGQDDTIGEDDFGGESGLGGMDPETGQPNIGSWATAKNEDRSITDVMGLFNDDPVAMGKAYGLKGKGYAYSDSFDFSKTALQHTNFIVDLMNKEFQKTYGKDLKDSKSVHDAMTDEQKEAMIADANAKTNAILSGIPDNIRDEVNLGINVTIANMMGYGPLSDTDQIPDWFGLPKETGFFAKAKAWAKNTEFNIYNTIAKTDATMLNMLGEEPGRVSDVTAIESGDGPD
jgi:hypothetical protein